MQWRIINCLNPMKNYKPNSEKLVDEALKADPGYELPMDFAGKMAVKFALNFEWKQYIREFLIYFLSGLGILGMLVAMFYFLMKEIWNKWIGFFTDHLTGIIGALILLTFILFMDKVLLQYFSFRQKHKPA